MRTRDFSRAPRMAQANAMFTGGNRYASVWALASTVPRWRRMVADMRRMRGYCAHKIYYEPPLTLGVLALGAMVAPALTSTSINGERRDGTLATTQMTLLTPAELTLGTWLAGCLGSGALVVGAIAVGAIGVWWWVRARGGREGRGCRSPVARSSGECSDPPRAPSSRPG